MQSSDEPPSVISAAEAAEMLDVDESTIARWAEAGKLLPIRKLPGRTGSWIFHRYVVDGYRELHRKAS